MTHTPLVDTDDLADLRSDIRVLGGLLGRTLVRQDSAELLELVEEVRRTARVDLGSTSDLLDSVDLPTSIRLARLSRLVHDPGDGRRAWRGPAGPG